MQTLSMLSRTRTVMRVRMRERLPVRLCIIQPSIYWRILIQSCHNNRCVVFTDSTTLATELQSLLVKVVAAANTHYAICHLCTKRQKIVLVDGKACNRGTQNCDHDHLNAR